MPPRRWAGSLARVASLNGDRRAPNKTGQRVTQGLGRDGNVEVVNNLGGFATYGVYEATLGHNIANVFWSLMNQKGVTVHDGRYVENDTVVDWLFAMGYPITEPYWIEISVQGQEQWVLMQAFQRRILTYSPYNPEGWKVEMGNVGRAYFDWRYAQQPPAPTPTPRPQVTPRITLDPTGGDTSTQVAVTGIGFPSHSAVLLGVERPEANYFRTLGTAAARSDGNFAAKVSIPADAARFSELVFTATANAGAVRATATFRMQFGSTLAVSPQEVVPNGTIRVQGGGFPASLPVNVGLSFNDRDVEWVKRTNAEASGNFDLTINIGNRAVGSTFRVVAVGEAGAKATAPTSVRVIKAPNLQVIPDRGPVGIYVTFRGTDWPAGRQISTAIKASGSENETWMSDLIWTDASSNFSREMYIYPYFAGKPELRLIAYEGVSTIRMEIPYWVVSQPTPTPLPNTPAVSVYPSVLTAGQPATVTGTNWQAGAAVMIGVGRPGFGVEQ